MGNIMTVRMLMTSKQRNDLLVLVRNLYIASVVGITPVMTVIWAHDRYVLSPTAHTSPIPTYITVAIGFLIINFAVAFATWEYFRKTQLRRNDPFRFALRQKRRLLIPAAACSVERAKSLLGTLGYQILTETAEPGSFHIEATRDRKKNLDRFPRGQARPAQRLIIDGKATAGSWSLELSCAPLKRYIVGDFTLTTFLSMKEYIEQSGWLQYLVDDVGTRIDMNWQDQR